MNPAWQTNWIVFIITQTHSHTPIRSICICNRARVFVRSSVFMLILSHCPIFFFKHFHRLRSRIQLIVNYLEWCSFLVNSTNTKRSVFTPFKALCRRTHSVVFFSLYFLFTLDVTTSAVAVVVAAAGDVPYFDRKHSQISADPGNDYAVRICREINRLCATEEKSQNAVAHTCEHGMAWQHLW